MPREKIFYTLMAGKDSEIWQKGIKLYLELSLSQTSSRSGDQSKYMFGYLIPRSYKEALEFDKVNNNTKWPDATRDEMDCIKEQEVFTPCQRAKWDSNHKRILNSPPNHHKIRVNMIFAVQYNGRHKARPDADGSLTPEPVENIYSGVVSLRHLRLVIF